MNDESTIIAMSEKMYRLSFSKKTFEFDARSELFFNFLSIRPNNAFGTTYLLGTIIAGRLVGILVGYKFAGRDNRL